MNRKNTHNCCRCAGNPADCGPHPFTTDLGAATSQNSNYRTALWTGEHLQLTLMCIPECGDIGLEAHPDTDQFLRIEEGCGRVTMGSEQNALDYQKDVFAGDAVFVPAHTWHNLINTGSRPLKLYSIYAPPHHPHGVVHKTKKDAQESEPEK